MKPHSNFSRVISVLPSRLKYFNLLIMSSLIFLNSTHNLEARTRHSKKIKEFEAEILSCHDGDTCRAKYKGEKIKIRFSGIDAPEIKQTEGKAAKRELEGLIVGKTVKLECDGKSYDRLTCTVRLNDVEINAEMVKRGYAFDSPKYSKGKYAEAMQSAKAQKIGIWKTIEVSPFCTRHKNNIKCKSDLLYNQ